MGLSSKLISLKNQFIWLPPAGSKTSRFPTKNIYLLSKGLGDSDVTKGLERFHLV